MGIFFNGRFVGNGNSVIDGGEWAINKVEIDSIDLPLAGTTCAMSATVRVMHRETSTTRAELKLTRANTGRPETVGFKVEFKLFGGYELEGSFFVELVDDNIYRAIEMAIRGL